MPQAEKPALSILSPADAAGGKFDQHFSRRHRLGYLPEHKQGGEG
jgi:hypothetical protein